MADSPAFELVCDTLERDSSLERLEARGTVRLAIKAAGLDARNVTPEQMAVVVTNILGRELETRGIADTARLCAALRDQLTTLDVGDAVDTPEAVFTRLGGA